MTLYKKTLRTWLPVAAGLLLLLFATSPSTFGQETRPLQVLSFEISGNAVAVTVSNPNAETRSGTVAVNSVVDGKVVLSVVPVSVSGHGATTATVTFPQPVEEVISLGMGENPDPFA